MTQKILANPWLRIILAAALSVSGLLMCSESEEQYRVMATLPVLDKPRDPEDGDTQVDTIKALQAYAKAAVAKAERLHEHSRRQARQVSEHRQQLHDLGQAHRAVEQTLADASARFQALEDELRAVKTTVDTAAQDKGPPSKADNKADDPAASRSQAMPRGFGFDALTRRTALLDVVPAWDTQQGTWHEAIDLRPEAESTQTDSGFLGLLSTPATANPSPPVTAPPASEPLPRPVYTLAKDAIFTDAIALTALIGRIPVEGKTPDPYPVKVLIGRENLFANGQVLPEIEGMIFSGLGMGDWNLSCVSARLYSASYVFSDGTIVNHSSRNEPLGYLSDPAGIPCVAGTFVSNAPSFLLKRAGLAGLGAAGRAYAEAQQQIHTSGLTGNTTRSLSGDRGKLVAGEVVQASSDEATGWLLARQKQSFDAVVVNPGARVAVHLSQTLTLDHAALARKIRHGDPHEDSHRSLD